MSQKTIQLSFFIGLTLLLLTLSFFVFKPYLGVVFLSSVFAVVFYPFYQKLLAKFNGRRQIASMGTVLIILICILIPAILISISLLKEAAGLYSSLAMGGADKLISALNILLSRLSVFAGGDGFAPYFAVDTYARDLLGWIIGHFDSVFTAVFGGLFNFILMLLSLYYLFIYGEKIKSNLIFWSPLPDLYDESILNVLRSSVDAVMRGRLLVSIAQGLFLGIGFAIFGIGNPVLWGFVGGFASLIPIIGTSIVTIPAAVFLFLSGHIGAGIGLLLWGALCVGLVDNVLSFFFLKGKIDVHPLLILFAILGGVELFGPIGFLIGPVVISALFAFMKIYPFIMSRKENNLQT